MDFPWQPQQGRDDEQAWLSPLGRISRQMWLGCKVLGIIFNNYLSEVPRTYWK